MPTGDSAAPWTGFDPFDPARRGTHHAVVAELRARGHGLDEPRVRLSPAKSRGAGRG
ncbi:MAG TPA: hypothetical protein VIL48_22045 [Acidimicrobiales bacterium]